MTEHAQIITHAVFLVGIIIVLVVILQALLNKVGVPGLVGFILLGLLITTLDGKIGFFNLSDIEIGIFEFLAELGIFCLLFRIGLESDIVELMKQLRRAFYVWFGDILVSSVGSFLLVYYLMGLPLLTSMFIAVALTVTSVGISMRVWRKAGKLYTDSGRLLLDVSEMDDIAGVLFIAVLFSLVPLLSERPEEVHFGLVMKSVGFVAIKFILFSAFCIICARYLEKYVLGFSQVLQSPPEKMLLLVGLGIIIASVGWFMGFSMAIGAFFAGLVFSEDPRAVKEEASFEGIYQLFSPFFLIYVGMNLEPSLLLRGALLGLPLFLIAVSVKYIGVGGPVFVLSGHRKALVLGTSMLPRAEIAMIVMHRGLSFGNSVVSSEVFSAMVFVVTATCIIPPPVMKKLLERYDIR